MEYRRNVLYSEETTTRKKVVRDATQKSRPWKSKCCQSSKISWNCESTKLKGGKKKKRVVWVSKTHSSAATLFQFLGSRPSFLSICKAHWDPWPYSRSNSSVLGLTRDIGNALTFISLRLRFIPHWIPSLHVCQALSFTRTETAWLIYCWERCHLSF